MKKIGVTGGIGSGKSLVCRIFSILGIPVYNADDRARWLTDANAEIVKEVKGLFGESIYVEGRLDRKRVAKEVFPNPSLLEKLNAIIHPRVGADFDAWSKKQMSAYIIKEAAVMFESNSYLMLDSVVNISAPPELRLQRIKARDPFRSDEEIMQIISNQMSEEERRNRSDYEIINDDRRMVIPQVLELHRRFSDQ